MNPLSQWTVFVGMNVVERGQAMARSTYYEIRRVKAPTEAAALNVGTALACDDMADAETVTRFAVTKAWIGAPTPGV